MYTASQQNELARKIGNWIKPRLNKIELIVSLFLALVLVFQAVSPIRIIFPIVFPLLCIASAYFFEAFAEINTKEANGMDSFIHKLSGYVSSILVVGILFRIMNWPGYNISLSIGLLLAFIGIVYMMIRINRGSENPYFSARVIIRHITLIIIGGFLFLAENEFLISIGVIR